MVHLEAGFSRAPAGGPGGKKPFETVAMPYGTQVLCPDHCIQGTPDADLVPGLSVLHAQRLIRKGDRRHIDSSSAFLEADGRTRTGLAGYMKDRGLGGSLGRAWQDMTAAGVRRVQSRDLEIG